MSGAFFGWDDLIGAAVAGTALVILLLILAWVVRRSRRTSPWRPPPPAIALFGGLFLAAIAAGIFLATYPSGDPTGPSQARLFGWLCLATLFAVLAAGPVTVLAPRSAAAMFLPLASAAAVAGLLAGALLLPTAFAVADIPFYRDLSCIRNPFCDATGTSSTLSSRLEREFLG
jgi:hypothetical protein